MSFEWEESHGWMVGQVFSLKADTTNPHSPKLKAGTKVKVVMASRFGDCGITTDLTKQNGYSNRVMPWELEQLPDIVYSMEVPEPPDYMKQLKRTKAPQYSLELIEAMNKTGTWR